MHEFVDEDFGLFFFAEFVKFFGDNLDDIMGLLVEGQLHDSGKSMTTSNYSFAIRTLTPYACHSRFIHMGHLKFMKNILYLCTNILGQFVLNHGQEISIIKGKNQED